MCSRGGASGVPLLSADDVSVFIHLQVRVDGVQTLWAASLLRPECHAAHTFLPCDVTRCTRHTTSAVRSSTRGRA
eukprot:4584327-Pleurochrysis_carterae.AAC.4